MTIKVLLETNGEGTGDWFRLSVNGDMVGQGHSLGPHDLKALVEAITDVGGWPVSFERKDYNDEDFPD